MAAGTPLDDFTTLMESTGPAWMRGPEVMVNDTVRSSYTGNRIAAAGNMVEMIQGGDSIQDRVYLAPAGGASSGLQRYDPNEGFEYDHAQPGVNWTVPWAFAWASMSWTKQDVGLNAESMGKRYRAQVYKRVMYEKHQNLYSRVCNSLEDEYWARPNAAKMEGTGSVSKRQPYSIPCFVNEFTNGLAPAIVDSSSTLWTTVQGITPGTTDSAGVYSKWKPYAVGGGITSGTNTGAEGGLDSGYNFTPSSIGTSTTLFAEFTKAYWNLRFDRLPKSPEYSDKTSSPNVIWCSLQGMVNYEHALQKSQDTFRGVGASTGQDPAYDGPTFRKIPLEYISSLDTALLYSDGTEAITENDIAADGNTGEGTAAIVGPRYYFINANYLKFVVHQDNYCVMTAPFAPDAQPFTRVQVMDLWNNTVCRSRARHGIVGPNETITNA